MWEQSMQSLFVKSAFIARECQSNWSNIFDPRQQIEHKNGGQPWPFYNMDVQTYCHTGCFSSGWIFYFIHFLFQLILLLHQPWRNLLIAWLVFSKQLESTLFNSSLALCLLIMGKLFTLKTKSQIFFRNAWSVVWFHCHSGLTARRKLGRKIVLVPTDGSPEKSD